jgi:hypothetical protein
MQVLVGDIHCGFFSDLYPGLRVNRATAYPGGRRLQVAVMAGSRFGSRYSTLSQRRRSFHVHGGRSRAQAMNN